MAKKPKVPAPDYKEMARKYVTWKAEDAAFLKESEKNIRERNRIEQSRAIARYSASGGDTSRIEGIRKEYAQKLAEDMEEFGQTRDRMQQSLEGGYTARTLREHYTRSETARLRGEAQGELDRIRSSDPDDRADRIARFNEEWSGRGVTARRDYETNDLYAQVNRDAIDPAGFDEWAQRFSGVDPSTITAPQTPEASEAQSTEGRIAFRRGERPRGLMSTQVQVNPWMET